MKKIAADDNYKRVDFYDALDRVVEEASEKMETPILEMLKVALRYIQASVDKLDGTLHRSEIQGTREDDAFTDQFDHGAHPYVRPKWPSEPSTVL